MANQLGSQTGTEGSQMEADHITVAVYTQVMVLNGMTIIVEVADITSAKKNSGTRSIVENVEEQKSFWMTLPLAGRIVSVEIIVHLFGDKRTLFLCDVKQI